MTSKNLIPMPLNPRDYDKVARLATAQRRRPTDILKNLLLDLDSGVIPLPAPPPIEEKPKRHSMCVRADDVLKSKADALKERLQAAGLDHVQVKKHRLDGDPVWRVRIGPLGDNEMRQTERKLSDLGLKGLRVGSE